MKTLIKRRMVQVRRVISSFRPTILSRHPSHRPLRSLLKLQKSRVWIRLGSTTPLPTDSKRRIEINIVSSVKNSSSKLLMKRCFDRGSIRHSVWIEGNTNTQNILSWARSTGYPIISKSHKGSRGVGNAKHDNETSLRWFLSRNSGANYIFEKFMPYSREYRLHISNSGCFYACRKLIKNGADSNIWQRHRDEDIIWVLEENPSFKRPSNWESIVQDCIRAKNSLGLDICGFDILVEGKETNPNWCILESNSACSLAEIGIRKYTDELNKIIEEKIRNIRQ